MSGEATTAQTAQSDVDVAANTADTTTEAPIAANGAENGDSAEAPADLKEATVGVGEAVTTEDKPGPSDKSTEMLRTMARADRKNYSANVKSDASVLPESDDPALIRTQIEFYFSDSNLPTDKFLWTQTGGTENKPIKLKVICGFKRMHRFKSYEAVVAAMRDSELMNVSGPKGDEVIARKTPYKLNSWRNKVDAASVYVKGFGDEEPSSQFDIEAFFAKFGSVNSVRLRRTESHLFKGSVFVEFQDEETAKKFLELDPKPQWKGHDLKILSKAGYQAEKNALFRDGDLELSSSAPRFLEGQQSKGRRGGRGRGRGPRDSRGADQDDWKKRREEDSKNGFSGEFRGRGGRGRGRGDRGRGRGDRGHRNQQRDQGSRPNRDTKPVIHATNEKGEVISKEAGSDTQKTDVGPPSNKRQRDETGNESEQPAKKIDTKAAVAEEDS